MSRRSMRGSPRVWRRTSSATWPSPGGSPTRRGGGGRSSSGFTSGWAGFWSDRSKALRVLTYNVHKCRGLDGRASTHRIVEVLREIDADLVALQEVLEHQAEAI